MKQRQKTYSDRLHEILRRVELKQGTSVVLCDSFRIDDKYLPYFINYYLEASAQRIAAAINEMDNPVLIGDDRIAVKLQHSEEAGIHTFKFSIGVAC